MARMYEVEASVGETAHETLAPPFLASSQGTIEIHNPAFKSAAARLQRLGEFDHPYRCRAKLADHDTCGKVGELHCMLDADPGAKRNGHDCKHRISGARYVEHLAPFCACMDRVRTTAKQRHSLFGTRQQNHGPRADDDLFRRLARILVGETRHPRTYRKLFAVWFDDLGPAVVTEAGALGVD